MMRMIKAPSHIKYAISAKLPNMNGLEKLRCGRNVTKIKQVSSIGCLNLRVEHINYGDGGGV